MKKLFSAMQAAWDAYRKRENVDAYLPEARDVIRKAFNAGFDAGRNYKP